MGRDLHGRRTPQAGWDRPQEVHPRDYGLLENEVEFTPRGESLVLRGWVRWLGHCTSGRSALAFGWCA